MGSWRSEEYLLKVPRRGHNLIPEAKKGSAVGLLGFLGSSIHGFPQALHPCLESCYALSCSRYFPLSILIAQAQLLHLNRQSHCSHITLEAK